MSISRKLLPLVVIGLGFGVAWTLVATGPKAKRETPAAPVPLVEVVTLQPQDYTVRLSSQGSVAARTQTALVAEVSGRITEISLQFVEGGFFEHGATLLRVDPRDYTNLVTIAEAEYAQQQLNLAQEKARSEQARRDWNQLGEAGKPSDLVLRKPQLASAEAAAAAARARLTQARLDLERTRVVAPFAGRVLEKKADVGQFVSKGGALATLYAIDYAEVRLPLTAEQLAVLRLPEQFRGQTAELAAAPRVTLRPRGTEAQAWEGRIVRSSGAFDPKTRQLFVVAQIDDPYGERTDGRSPLKVGSFVSAEIDGETWRNVFVIPRTAVREGREVLIADDGKLRRRAIDVIWSNEREAVIRAGLAPGERLITTAVSFAVDGAAIRIEGDSPGAATAPPKDTGG
ncbi:MAG: efflux RND transporter periplasmic adaptor subunit [Thiotrichales bacterium]